MLSSTLFAAHTISLKVKSFSGTYNFQWPNVPIICICDVTLSILKVQQKKNVRVKRASDLWCSHFLPNTYLLSHLFADLLESFHKKLNEIRIRILWDHIGLLVSSSWQQCPCSQYTTAHPRNTCLSITHRYFKRGHRRLGLCTFQCHFKNWS